MAPNDAKVMSHAEVMAAIDRGLARIAEFRAGYDEVLDARDAEELLAKLQPAIDHANGNYPISIEDLLPAMIAATKQPDDGDVWQALQGSRRSGETLNQAIMRLCSKGAH
jgi:hypothetical protein